MSDVTRILDALGSGDGEAAEQLLPIVYEELRRLAAQKMAAEKPGQTLNATALVHEAYLRLIGSESSSQKWNGRGHFFAAAAEAMRRILIENARRKRGPQRGGDWRRVDLHDVDLEISCGAADELIAIDEALTRFTTHDPAAADLVKLRYFVGLSIEEAGDALGLSRATAYRQWSYAKAWLRREIEGMAQNSEG